MFNPDEILQLKRFLQSIIEKPMPMDTQHPVRDGVFLWCDEWEMIEILKYLFNGREMYILDPPPNRLKNNPLWSKEDIMQKAEALIAEHFSAAAIIETLKRKREQNAPRV